MSAPLSTGASRAARLDHGGWVHIHDEADVPIRVVEGTQPVCVKASMGWFAAARQMTHMEWPSGAAPGDAVIFREDPSSRSPFVVQVGRGAALACATYAEAEARAASYAERARANVWYVERGRLQLICSFCHLRQV